MAVDAGRCESCPVQALCPTRYAWVAMKASIEGTLRRTTILDLIEPTSGTTSTIAECSYDAVGNRTLVELANGTSTEYTYDDDDPRCPLDAITHKSGTATIPEIDYTAVATDHVGNPKSMTLAQSILDAAGSLAYH